MTHEAPLLTEGIDMRLDGERLVFGDDVHITRSGQRKVSAMSHMFDAADESDDSILYDTFVDVWEERDHDAFGGGKLGYSLTSIRALPVGEESPKTHGHVHTPKPDGFPPAEAYEVLNGSGVFIMQDMHDGPETTFAVAVHANVGDVVVIPGALYHCSVNAGTERFVFSDLCRRGMSDYYQHVHDAGGFSYKRRADGDFVANSNYASLPELEHVTAEEWSGRRIPPLYRTLRDDPASLEWLRDREAFVREFPRLADFAYPVGLARL
ncbi:glucose-6-phosphate isomerase family protein [Leucobacter sp. wl10]|uniref:glucose-6-phosphate isomerase family protein n=1 Tax=Leucobacter sp. wl10 TaxID=2304677 RepID=UPI000E5BF8E7|nr:glucose-6-phosphate isomerase family protein [Leucobacter sp. wl10]RGE19177.1 hypothetical protein D1J51_12830 [Leucobacter sp. wl10]